MKNSKDHQIAGRGYKTMAQTSWRTHLVVDGMTHPLGKTIPVQFLIGRMLRSGRMEHFHVSMPHSGLLILGTVELPIYPHNQPQYFGQYINRQLAFQDIIYKPTIPTVGESIVMMTINMLTGVLYFNSAVISRSDKWGLLIKHDEEIPTQSQMFPNL